MLPWRPARCSMPPVRMCDARCYNTLYGVRCVTRCCGSSGRVPAGRSAEGVTAAWAQLDMEALTRCLLLQLLQEMIKKFGVKESASPKKKKGAADDAEVKTEKKTRDRKRKADDVKDEEAQDDDEDKKAKKPRKKAEATCEANQALADAFAELSGFEFKRGEKFKGGTWSKVAKAIRECESAISCGKDALKLKGVGKSSSAKIDEFLETGTLEKLEEYRAGNM
ncbi:unnamed protein product [Phytophthora fragariaefolia]|uniref:Unnamed protein product n=1 Tax=Phytophthora fragariaefolia TaxID=1490495 RepID=A0A9W6XXE0_9STRA|nr:unnamed protein product [Phytophthora fragariaefolia]